jgi:hypothetical protein
MTVSPLAYKMRQLADLMKRDRRLEEKDTVVKG